MTTIALSTILERVSQRVWPNRRHKLTATGGSSTTFVDSSAIYSSASNNTYDGVGLIVTSNSDEAGESPEGDFRRVTRGGHNPANGTFTVDTWSTSTNDSAIETGDTALLLYALDDNEIVECVNEVIRTMPMDRYVPLSLTDDPGMDYSGTDSYTALTSATLAKTTTEALVFSGSQALQVTSNGTAGSGVRTEDIMGNALVDMTVGEHFYVSVILSIVSGKWELVIQDTSGTELYSVAIPSGTYSTPDSKWFDVRFDVSNTLTGNSGISVAFKETEGAISVAVIDSVSLLSDRRRTYRISDDIADTKDIIGLVEVPEGVESEYPEVFIPFQYPFHDIPYTELRDFFGVNKNRVQVPTPRGNPYWIKYRGTGTELSKREDYSTGSFNTYFAQTVTIPDEDTFMSGVLAQVYKRLGDEGEFRRYSKLYHSKIREFMPPIIKQRPTPRVMV